ncbi:MAG: hypothetical protein GF401_20670 [Chitinivibrionales bacterium]|nr:hypothetical protein [Chitinivibrionales bacterium]
MSQTRFNTMLPLILWACIIVILSSIPGEQMPIATSMWQWDKIAHFGEYCILGFLLMRHINYRNPSAGWNLIAVWIFFALLFACIDEVHQTLIPNRMCTWQDFIADSLGIFSGFALWHIRTAKKKVA